MRFVCSNGSIQKNLPHYCVSALALLRRVDRSDRSVLLAVAFRTRYAAMKRETENLYGCCYTMDPKNKHILQKLSHCIT